MVKIKKTYRLDERTVKAIVKIQEIYERNTGIKLSDGMTVDVAIYDLGNYVDEKIRSGEWK